MQAFVCACECLWVCVHVSGCVSMYLCASVLGLSAGACVYVRVSVGMCVSVFVCGGRLCAPVNVR